MKSLQGGFYGTSCVHILS